MSLDMWDMWDMGGSSSSNETPAPPPLNTYVASVTAGTVTPSNESIQYTFVIRLDSAANSEQTINYQITGIGQSPTSSDDFANNQALIGTVTFAPGETQKSITVNVLNKDKTEANEAFTVTLTSNVSTLMVASNGASVISAVTDQPNEGGASLVGDKLFFHDTPATPFTPTSSADYVKVAGSLILKTGAGDDEIISTTGVNRIAGEAGNDKITLGMDKNFVEGGSGNDTIISGPSLGFADGNLSYIDGGTGTDKVDFSNLQESIIVDLDRRFFRNEDADFGFLLNVESVVGTNYNDIIEASKWGNVIDGGGGNDIIRAGKGNDAVFGGAGDDEVDGQSGVDILTGGSGRDYFQFSSGVADIGKTATKCDTITDFTSGEDRIFLDFDLNTKAAGVNVNFTFLGNGNFTKHAGEVRYSNVYNVKGESFILVQGDTNGDGNADFVIKLLGVTSLKDIDFVI